MTSQALAEHIRATISRDRAHPHLRSVIDGDEEPLRAVLSLLERDHYLRRDSAAGSFRFRFPLIQRWWRVQRT